MKPARRPSHTGAACGPVFCVFLCRFLLTAGQNAVILYVIPQRFIVVRNYVVLATRNPCINPAQRRRVDFLVVTNQHMEKQT